MWGTPGVQGPLGGGARGDDHLPPPVGELWNHSNLLHMAGTGEEEGTGTQGEKEGTGEEALAGEEVGTGEEVDYMYCKYMYPAYFMVCICSTEPCVYMYYCCINHCVFFHLLCIHMY